MIGLAIQLPLILTQLYAFYVFTQIYATCDCELVYIGDIDKPTLLGLLWIAKTDDIRLSPVPFGREDAIDAINGGHIHFFGEAEIDVDLSGDYACPAEYEKKKQERSTILNAKCRR